jgi:hypothetical protein
MKKSSFLNKSTAIPNDKEGSNSNMPTKYAKVNFGWWCRYLCIRTNVGNFSVHIT